MDLDLSMAPPAAGGGDASGLDLSMAPAVAAGAPSGPELDLTPRREQASAAEQFLRGVSPAEFPRQQAAKVLDSGAPNTMVLERSLMRNSQPSTPYTPPEEDGILDRMSRIAGYEGDFAEHTGFGGVFGSVAKQAVRAVPSMAKSTNEALAMTAGAMDSTERAVLGKYSSGLWSRGRDWLLGQSELIRQRILSDPALSLPKELQGRLWDNPQYLLNPEWLAFNAGDTASSMAPMIAATILSGGNTLVGSAVGAAQEAGDLYRELVVEDKADPDRALAASLVFGVAVSGLNKLGLDKIMDRKAASTILGRAAKAAVAGGTEAVTEWMEEPIQAALQGMANNEGADKVQARILDALKNVDVMPGAFLLGGGVSLQQQRSGAAQQAAKPQAKPAEQKDQEQQAPSQDAAAQPTAAQPTMEPGDKAGPETPSGEDVMPYTREDAHEAIRKHLGDEQAGPVLAVFDGVAESWAERNGSTAEAFYEKHLAGIVSPQGHVTPQAAPAEQGQEADADPWASAKEGGMLADDLRQVLEPIQQKAVNAAPMTIVQGVQDLPEHLRADAERGGGTPTAVFDPDTGKMFMLAGSITSPEHALRLWVHEQGAHMGLRGLLGDGMNDFLDRVADGLGEERLIQMAKLHGLNLNMQEDVRHAAEEHLASLAEKAVSGQELTEQEQGLWDELVAMLRSWLESVGVVDPKAISDEEIHQTLHDAIVWVMEGNREQRAETKADAKARRAELRRLFQETLPNNTAWRIKSFLLYGDDPMGIVSTVRSTDKNVRRGRGVGLDYDSAVYTFGKEALEGIQHGLVKKNSSYNVDRIMHEFGLESADAIYDALHFNKAKAEEQFTRGGGRMLYQGAMLDQAREIGRRITTEMKSWAVKIDQFLAGKVKVGSILSIGSTPEVLTALGVKELPLLMRQKVLAKIMGEGEKDHNLSADIVKRLPALIADPVAVFRSGEKATAKGMVVLTEASDKNGDPVLVAVHLSIKDGGIEFNDVASVYGKRNIGKWLADQVAEKNVLYLDKKKAAGLQVSARLQSPIALNSGGAKKILSPADIVKPIFENGSMLPQDAAPGESRYSNAQARASGPRAGVQFLDDGRAILHLFKSADASSVIHETGHILRPLLPEADQRVIETWAGVKDGVWTREAEETFAKGFERYCYEGKAPTSRLRRAFSLLRTMLIRIYGNIRRIGGVELSDDVRKVFDRMVSTQAEREAEAQAADTVHSFHVDPEAGMPGYEEELPAKFSEIREYEDLMAEAERLAYERFGLERRKELRGLRAQWRREGRELADSYLPHRAMDAALAQGGLDLEAITEAYDGEFVRLLSQKRPGLVRREGGVNPEEVAHEHGYDDAHSMLEDILDTPGKGQIMQDYMAAREEAYQRQRALDADFGGDYLAIQDAALEILGQLTAKQALRLDTMQARATVDELRMYDLGRLRAQARAERLRLQDQARKAFDAGQREQTQTLFAKMRQNDLLLREMERSLAEREKMERSARTMLSRRIDEDWRQQARNWAGLFGLGGARADGTGPELLDFLAAKGLHHFVDQDAIASLARVPRGGLTVDQYRDVHRVLRQIIHFGTWDTRIMGQQKAQEFDAVMGGVLSTILAKGPASPHVNIHPTAPSARRTGTMGEFLDGVAAYHAELLKPEHIFRQLDGQADMGATWTACYKPLVDSRNEFLRLGGQVQELLQQAFATVQADLKRWRKQRITIPEVPRNVVIKKGKQVEVRQGAPLQLTMEEIVMVALNSGNDGNRNALKAGFQWTEGDLAAILARLGEREWAVVHQVWDAIEAIYPHLNRAHKRLTGVDLKKVQATPYVATTEGGQRIEVRGGYFPLMFDRELSWKADRQQAQAEAQDLFQSIYQKPNPKSGFTKERVGGQMAPRLDFGVIARHVLDTAHYATHAVAIRDVQKITTDPRFREAVEAAWSRPVYEQIAPWLQNVARPAKEERTRIERFFARARRNVQIVAMGWKPFTAALQLTSLTSTVQKVGLANTLRAVGKTLAHPHDAAQFIGERSIALRNRKNSFDRDVVNLLGQFDPGKSGVLDRVHQTAFALIGVVDSAVAYTTWQAAYTQAMEQNGWDEAKACEYADMQVRLSQGDGTAMSLAQVQHGSELRKFVTMFYSWFSANYNNIAEANRRIAGEGASLPAVLDLAKAYWWLLVAPALLEQLLRHGPPDDEKERREMGLSIFSYFMASFPVLRSMVSSVVEGRRFQVSPIEDALEAPADLVNAFKAKQDRGRKIAKTALLGAGYLWGLPTRQAVTVMDTALDMAQGKTKNPMRFLVPEQKKKASAPGRRNYAGN